MKRISSRKIGSVRLDLPEPLNTCTATLIAFGNLVQIEKRPWLWCLFCDEEKKLHESIQPLSLMPYFPIGSRFNNGHFINTAVAHNLYSIFISKEKTKIGSMPRKLLQADLSGFIGDYCQQGCIKVRDKQILVTELIIRALCPDPGFGKIMLSLLSESFLFRHIMSDGDHLHVELDNIFTFRITAVVARHLAWLASNEEYRNWHESIVLYAGDALASAAGKPWQCSLPDFKLKLTYSVVESPGWNPVYRVDSVLPVLAKPYRKITIYLKQKAQTFAL